MQNTSSAVQAVTQGRDPRGVKQMKNGFVVYQMPGPGARPDEDEMQAQIQEMEARLFGITRVS